MNTYAAIVLDALRHNRNAVLAQMLHDKRLTLLDACNNLIELDFGVADDDADAPRSVSYRPSLADNADELGF